MTKHRNNHHTSDHGLAVTMERRGRLGSVIYSPTSWADPEFIKFGPWVVVPHESARKSRHRTLYGAIAALKRMVR